MSLHVRQDDFVPGRGQRNTAIYEKDEFRLGQTGPSDFGFRKFPDLLGSALSSPGI